MAEISDVGKVLEGVLQAGQKAELFMTPKELMEADNYLRAFTEELEILGQENDDDAVEAARKREPEGFKAAMKMADMQEMFRLQEK